MEFSSVERTTVSHIVAMPFPGRGHINPMMNLCKLLSSKSKKQHLLITFVVTEEWLGYIGSDPKPNNIRFASIPNVVPPERLKAADFPGFYEAVMTKMEAPFEKLLDELEQPVDAMLGDVELLWTISVGNRRNIPVASVWTMPAVFFSMLHHWNLFLPNRHLPLNSLELGEQHVDHIPGLSSTQVADLQTIIHETDPRVLQLAMECISRVPKAQYLLLTSVYELEPQAFDTLNAIFPFPVCPIGPAIPYLELEHNSSITRTHNIPNYLQWLDSHPAGSVLYISLGSFLSVSGTQMDEIAAGLRNSGVRFLWVVRGEAFRLKESCGDLGLVVPWCDQLKVLCHSSVGGFWTHCGWNSTLEAIFAGVPMLTFPLFLDQVPNSRLIVEDWKIGWRVNRSTVGSEISVTKEEISELVQSFMNMESGEGKELRERARALKDICHQAIGDGGSSYTNLDAFLEGISQSHNH
ncbi:UDP-glycosyltransferase 87A2 [Quercus suber]|uniref:UDP-glycosyltransferase 87A2 n=1 Tax=Quercus suber TaxID=58331 RepID=UPI0032DE6D34